MEDLLGKYHPDITVFDDSLDHIHELGIVRSLADEAPVLAANYYNFNQTWHGGKQEGVFTIKEVPTNLKSAVTESFENSMDDAIMPDPWQVETEIGGWQYQRGHAFRGTDKIIKALVDVVSRNGNLLVGIVQRPDGSIEPETEKFLAEMTAWTRVNGEAIFGTRPWKVYGEGPWMGAPRKKYSWGPTELYQDRPFTAEDIRYTTKGRALYACALGLPKSDIRLRALAGAKISGVTLLGSDEKINWHTEPDALVIKPVANWPSKYAVAFKIQSEKE